VLAKSIEDLLEEKRAIEEKLTARKKKSSVDGITKNNLSM
jgi:hypothetical protein